MENIFSTYTTGENRVTASFLAVLRSLSLDRIQRILGALLGQSEFELVQFRNQPSRGGIGVPDAIIEASVKLLIETKIERNTVKLPQIERHLERLNEAVETTALLLVLTPDDVRPAVLDELDDATIVWASFAMVDQAIDEILDDKYEVVSEREAFLLRELQGMLSAEGLLADVNDIAIVAARKAWPEYNDLHAYICQANRPFRQVSRIGFYSKGVIYPLVPKIIATFDEVEMQRDTHEGDLGTLVNRILDEELRPEGKQFKVLLLSSPDSPDTIKLAQPIPNDKRSKTGKPTAFTMGQRYVSSKALVTAKTTSDLD
jgi:hypothetical protein